MTTAAERLRGMFDMSIASADAFNRLSPAGFRLLREAHDALIEGERYAAEADQAFQFISRTYAERMSAEDDKTASGIDAVTSLQRALEEEADDFASDMNDAETTGERPDLDDRLITVHVAWVREVLDSLDWHKTAIAIGRGQIQSRENALVADRDRERAAHKATCQACDVEVKRLGDLVDELSRREVELRNQLERSTWERSGLATKCEQADKDRVKLGNLLTNAAEFGCSETDRADAAEVALGKLREACIAGRDTLVDLRDRFTGEGTKYLTAYDNYDSFYQGMVNQAIDEMEEALT